METAIWTYCLLWYRCLYKLVKSLENIYERFHFNKNHISDVCNSCKKKKNSFYNIFKGISICSCISWFLRTLEARVSRKPFQWLLLRTTLGTSQLNKVIILGSCFEVSTETLQNLVKHIKSSFWENAEVAI